MYYVYLIKSTRKKWRYIGFTNDLSKRFQEHNIGQVKSTKVYKPFQLIYHEDYLDKTDAIKRELELKTKSQQKEILFKKLKIN